jgi:predicted GIY-YIG superfamily endonuclease
VFYVYVLRSESDSGFYIGFSTNLRARLRQHQDGESLATKSRGPWKLIYYEAYTEREDAEAEGPSKTLRLTRFHPYLEKMDSALAGGFAPHPGDAGGGGAIHPRKSLRSTRLWPRFQPRERTLLRGKRLRLTRLSG